MTRPKSIPGRLKGGLSRIARALRLDLRREDFVWALMGCFIGGLMGWLFVAMWNR